MCRYPKPADPNELFPALQDEIGAIHSVKELCPRVYYIDVWKTEMLRPAAASSGRGEDFPRNLSLQSYL